MTVYYQTLALQYPSTNPTPTTLNIASGDTIELGIDTSSYADGNGWLRFGTPIGCTTSATSGADGGAVTITPNVGATSYSVTFRTLISETSSYLYGRIAGTISTGGADTTPDAFSFTDQTNVSLSTTISSGAITVSGIDAASAISISGGTYSINGGAYTSSSGTVTNGQTVTVQHTSSASNSTATNTTLTIGGVSDTFTSTTVAAAADTTPDAFTFTDQTNVALSSTITSNSITVSGITAAASISITGGTYSINGGAYTSATGSVTNGQTVSVQHTSSASNSTATNTTLTIGGVSDVFTSTTVAAAAGTYTLTFYDTSFIQRTIFNEGESFYIFIGTTGVPDGTYYWSTSSGSDLVAPVNGSFAISGNFGSLYLTIAADSLTETPTESLIIYIRSGSISGTILANSSITINDTSTSPGDTTPDAFTFTDQTNVALSSTITSNTITVSGISAASAISITGGTYSINGGAYTATSGTVTNGQTVSVRHTSSASNITVTNTTLTVGGVSDTFTSTTVAAGPDTTPDAFTFTDQTNVALSSTITSAAITVSGITAASAISIAGGTYSINGGAYTSSSGTVTNAQTVTVQHTSSASNSTATNTTLTIGGVSDVFTSTTLAAAAIDTTPDAFSFTDVGGAATNTVYTDTVTITGLQPNYSITVTASGGTVDAGTSALSGTFASSKTVTTDALGSIIIAARVTSSASAGTTTSCIVTVGTLSDTFSVTTFSSGNQVNQFTFTDIDNASFSTVYTSNAITIAGLSPGLSAFVVIGNGTYSKNGGAYVSANGGTVTNGDVITVRGTSSANYSTQVSVILTIYVNSGGIIGANVSDTFAINTPKFNYSLTPNFISMYEGSTMPLVLETIGVANGTTLYWTLNAATTADFSAVSGSFTVNSNTGTFSITALTDALTEGTETYTLAVRSGSTAGTVLTTSTVLVTDPPANAYGMQILDSNGNIVMDTSTYTVKEVKYSVSVTASTSISVPSIISDTVAQVIELSSGTDPLAVGSVSIDYINKLLVVSGGSGFLATINLMDYR